MSQTKTAASRRTVLKKGAAASSLLAGGLVASSGSASADGRFLRAQGQGEYHIQLYADNVEIIERGVEMTVTEYSTTSGTLWDLQGTVDGEINSTPNDYAQWKVYGFDEFGPKTWDDGVEVYWKGDRIYD